MDAYKASIVVTTRPGNGSGQFMVYFMVGKNPKKQGVVKVTLDPQYCAGKFSNPQAVAELSALNYLLTEVEVLSQGRTGNGVLIVASVRAVREIKLISELPKFKFDELMKASRDTKYIVGTKLTMPEYRVLFNFAKPLLLRFGEARVECVADLSWISPVIQESRQHEIEVSDHPLPLIEMRDGTKLVASHHAFAKFRSRLSNPDEGEAWKMFLGLFRDGLMQPVSWPAAKQEFLQEKYGYIADLYQHPEYNWLFVITKHKRAELPIVLTCYPKR